MNVMHRRHAKRNVPIELLRALVAVVEGEGFTKAAETLSLTQSAISAQIRRLTQIVGGSVLDRGPGVRLTRRGLIVLNYARRILMMNDELLMLAGPTQGPQQLVVGLPAWWEYQNLIDVVARCSTSPTGEKISFRSDQVGALVRDVAAGSVDLAFLCSAPDSTGQRITQWSEPLCWMKSPKLTLEPGAVIPLVSWPGTKPDRVALELFHEHGMKYAIVFSAPDPALRRAAVVAGLGVLPCLQRVMTEGMEIVHDGLPPLPSIETALFAREGLNLRRLAPFLRILQEALKPKQAIGLPLPFKQPAPQGATVPIRNARSGRP
jgi:DNA-binding transcriptional LysR family regulator